MARERVGGVTLKCTQCGRQLAKADADRAGGCDRCGSRSLVVVSGTLRERFS